MRNKRMATSGDSLPELGKTQENRLENSLFPHHQFDCLKKKTSEGVEFPQVPSSGFCSLGLDVLRTQDEFCIMVGTVLKVSDGGGV